jgi:hypothetical protein
LFFTGFFAKKSGSSRNPMYRTRALDRAAGQARGQRSEVGDIASAMQFPPIAMGKIFFTLIYLDLP